MIKFGRPVQLIFVQLVRWPSVIANIHFFPFSTPFRPGQRRPKTSRIDGTDGTRKRLRRTTYTRWWRQMTALRHPLHWAYWKMDAQHPNHIAFRFSCRKWTLTKLADQRALMFIACFAPDAHPRSFLYGLEILNCYVRASRNITNILSVRFVNIDIIYYERTCCGQKIVLASTTTIITQSDLIIIRFFLKYSSNNFDCGCWKKISRRSLNYKKKLSE
jgi:hypothetical protein